jgi:hypothetical protein
MGLEQRHTSITRSSPLIIDLSVFFIKEMTGHLEVGETLLQLLSFDKYFTLKEKNILR